MMHRVLAANDPVPPEYLRILDRIDRLASSLDYDFRVPFTNVRFGWDPIIGLLPIAGDLFALALSLRIIDAAHALGASPNTLRRMALNAGIDAVVGVVPIAGTVFDVFFKANMRNIDLLMAEIQSIRSPAPAQGILGHERLF